jgi:hypothetical protein
LFGSREAVLYFTLGPWLDYISRSGRVTYIRIACIGYFPNKIPLGVLAEFSFGCFFIPEFMFKGFNDFVNDLPDEFLRLAYLWAENMPRLAATQDFKPRILGREDLAKNQTFPDVIDKLSPVLTIEDLKCPVRHKVVLNADFRNAVSLFLNRQSDYLGVVLKIGEGKIIVLPEYNDNEAVIRTFLNKLLPRLYTGPTRQDIVDTFVSPTEQAAQQEIQAVESERQALDERLEKAKERLAFGERSKRKTIESDETAVRIISYYNTATQQEDVALFYV